MFETDGPIRYGYYEFSLREKKEKKNGEKEKDPGKIYDF